MVPAWLVSSTLAVAALGVLASAYLTFEHFTAAATLACPETGVVNCAKVTESSYATVLGVPVAVLGLAFFVAMTALCVPAAWRSPSRALRQGRLAAVCVGAVFVLYLLWVELFAVNAICLWCTGVHVLALALFVLVVLGAAVASPGDTSRSGRWVP